MTLKSKVKSLLISYLPNSEFARLIFYLPIIRKFDFTNSKLLKTREEVYNYLNENYINNTAISYLEFGVYKGESIFLWSKLNNNQNSEFIGFDTFTGLPENWRNLNGVMRKNHFDTNGIEPKINDPRCKFIKGLFQDTLSDFLQSFTPKDQLVIHNDSDLYSSTLFTLVSIFRFLKKGTIIIFDEFSSPLHELRAFDDFVTSHLIKFHVICHTNNYVQIAIQIL